MLCLCHLSLQVHSFYFIILKERLWIKLKSNYPHLGSHYGEKVSYLDQEHQRQNGLAGSSSSTSKLEVDFAFPKLP